MADTTFLAQDPMFLGTKWNGSPGSVILTDEWGSQKIVMMNGAYRDITHNKHVFYASNQVGSGGQAVSVWDATAYTGLYLWNPAGSTITVSLLQVSTGLHTAEAAISALGIGKFSTMTTENHAITPVCCSIPNATGAQCHAGYDATISAPTQIIPIVGGVLATAFPYVSGPVDLGGIIEFGPSNGVVIMAMSAVTGWFSFVWEEIPN